MIALRTEQPQGRTVGWLPHVARNTSEPRRDLSLAVQRGDVADQAADLTTLMSEPACGRLIPGAKLGAPGGIGSSRHQVESGGLHVAAWTCSVRTPSCWVNAWICSVRSVFFCSKSV